MCSAPDSVPRRRWVWSLGGIAVVSGEMSGVGRVVWAGFVGEVREVGLNGSGRLSVSGFGVVAEVVPEDVEKVVGRTGGAVSSRYSWGLPRTSGDHAQITPSVLALIRECAFCVPTTLRL